MRKYTSWITKLQKRCKDCNRQVFDFQILWGKVAKLQPLYKNIKSYYYYIDMRKCASSVSATFASFCAQTLYWPTFHRMQTSASLDARSASFGLSKYSNAILVLVSEDANLKSLGL